MKTIRQCALWLVVAMTSHLHLLAQIVPPVPVGSRGNLDYEREGTHDANDIRTSFKNYGMVGDYPADPINVNLAVFHSVEVPKGSGVNYSDGVTPFVLAKLHLVGGDSLYLMETGFRERQENSPFKIVPMKFEPRPGYFEPDPARNLARSPAISNLSYTWPSTWPDKDHTWDGEWNGYFGKIPAADQESFTVMDDDYYDKWRAGSSNGSYFPDSRDSSRHGLGLRVEVRGFQWSNVQAQDVIFWHYDITNEGTKPYPLAGEPENIIFGLYMDSGVGGESVSCDGVAESDDDNARFDTTSGLNLVYTWDAHGHGRGKDNPCYPTGYLGYAYLETPGKPFDFVDNDGDGITDEKRDSGPGTLIIGSSAILAYAAAHYDTAAFSRVIGAITRRPAVVAGRWWTGDEDMDWTAQTDDVGADGLAGTNDEGEGDLMPTSGEPHFDKTDKDESDQIGLTGFKLSYINNPGGTPDNVVFFKTGNQPHPDWPRELYDMWTSPIVSLRFDPRIGATNVNIGFLFASGPFTLPQDGQQGATQRFSLALAFGPTLPELRNTVKVVQAIYNSNYQFATPPPTPTVKAETGDHYVRLTWDDAAERSTDPVVGVNDFEGYRVYRATDPEFQDPRVITNGLGTSRLGNGKPIAQFDLKDGIVGFSEVTATGVSYYYGSDNGVSHTFLDTTVTNGQEYYYAVCSYDFGPSIPLPDLSVFTYYPSENSITVSKNLRGGTILPKNAVVVRPNPKVLGYTPANASAVTRVAGFGTGTVGVQVVDSKLVPDNHLFKISFNATPEQVHANSYNLIDSTTRTVIFKTGSNFGGLDSGLAGVGLMPSVYTLPTVVVDTVNSGFASGSQTNTIYKVTYGGNFPINLRRKGFPYDVTITFSNVVIDTAYKAFGAPTPVKFRVIAETPSGNEHLKCFFNDLNNDSTLSHNPGGSQEEIRILTGPDSLVYSDRYTWYIRIKNDTATTITPTLGDVYHLRLLYPFTTGDEFLFTSTGEVIGSAEAQKEFKEPPYVVPNPYVGAASFEPSRFTESGRGVRRMEFRRLPLNCTVRIYTVHGELVQTLRQDGSTDGYIPWDLRTKDNLDVAPGLYIYHVDAGQYGDYIGKFAIIK